MKTLFGFGIVYFLTSLAIANSEIKIDVTSSNKTYETRFAQVYDGATGETFPYRITVSIEMDGCTSGQFTVSNTGEYLGTITYFFKQYVLTPAKNCLEPAQRYSQSFVFKNGAGFVETVVPTGASVKIERIFE